MDHWYRSDDPIMATKTKYVTISLPTGISDEIDELIEMLEYWPSRGAFVREACLAKIREEKRTINELMKPRKGFDQTLGTVARREAKTGK